jgi:hypothetical protein
VPSSPTRMAYNIYNLVYLNRRPPLDDFSQHASMPHHFYQFQIHIILIPRHSVFINSFVAKQNPLIPTVLPTSSIEPIF